MTWTLTFLEQHQILETVYSDPLTLQDLIDAVQANMAMAMHKGTLRFLGDCRSLKDGDSPVDTYELGNFIASLRPGPEFREALLLPPAMAARETLEFYQTVTANRGITVKAFTDRDEAIRWLLAPAQG